MAKTWVVNLLNNQSVGIEKWEATAQPCVKDGMVHFTDKATSLAVRLPADRTVFKQKEV